MASDFTFDYCRKNIGGYDVNLILLEYRHGKYSGSVGYYPPDPGLMIFSQSVFCNEGGEE